MTAIRTVFATPVFRMLAAIIGLIGCVNASIMPYQSLIGIENIGLSHAAFAAVMVLASAVAVTASVYVGILSDQKANRRRVALITAAIGLIGSVMMLGAPHPLTFILAHGVLIPIATSLFGQTFALNRLASQAFPTQREGIQATVRAAMSVTFLLMLLFWTYAFAQGFGVMSIYVTGAVASLCLVTLIMARWPKDGSTAWQDRPSGLRLSQALAQLARPTVSLRLLCLGAVASSGILYMVLVSLIFEQAPGRSTSDVALYVGLVAGWEVPFMLLLPRYLGHLPRARLILLGTALYICHLVLMPVLAPTSAIWAMTFVAGLGGTAMLILPLSYYQDLLASQPGTAAALMALQKLVGDILAALAFTIGTSLGGYGLTALMGGAIALTGAAGLWLLDHYRPART
ncbi:MAG: MFS transporter [Rhodobacteraceae bacterium]|nr:MFS transporter [Paracoccaceae bacterium]MCF8513620.1 MFS transporter [Paracoccaceae bacterium]MCF8517480.1 MFS transporter [Paracoccaceae bacterium]